MATNKKEAPAYKIDFVNNTITVTKKFAEAASQLDTQENKLMMKLRKMNPEMTIEVKLVAKREGKPRMSYEKMMKYISTLAEADSYMKDFQAIRVAAKGQKNHYAYVERWFMQTFPNYDQVPEFDENRKIIVTPVDYAA